MSFEVLSDHYKPTGLRAVGGLLLTKPDFTQVIVRLEGAELTPPATVVSRSLFGSVVIALAMALLMAAIGWTISVLTFAVDAYYSETPVGQVVFIAALANIGALSGAICGGFRSRVVVGIRPLDGPAVAIRCTWEDYAGIVARSLQPPQST